MRLTRCFDSKEWRGQSKMVSDHLVKPVIDSSFEKNFETCQMRCYSQYKVWPKYNELSWPPGNPKSSIQSFKHSNRSFDTLTEYSIRTSIIQSDPMYSSVSDISCIQGRCIQIYMDPMYSNMIFKLIWLSSARARTHIQRCIYSTRTNTSVADTKIMDWEDLQLPV